MRLEFKNRDTGYGRRIIQSTYRRKNPCKAEVDSTLKSFYRRQPYRPMPPCNRKVARTSQTTFFVLWIMPNCVQEVPPSVLLHVGDLVLGRWSHRVPRNTAQEMLYNRAASQWRCSFQFNFTDFPHSNFKPRDYQLIYP